MNSYEYLWCWNEFDTQNRFYPNWISCKPATAAGFSLLLYERHTLNNQRHGTVWVTIVALLGPGLMSRPVSKLFRDFGPQTKWQATRSSGAERTATSSRASSVSRPSANPLSGDRSPLQPLHTPYRVCRNGNRLLLPDSTGGWRPAWGRPAGSAQPGP